MKNYLPVLIALIFFVPPIFSQELKPGEITAESLHSILDENYFAVARIDEDGDLSIKIDGILVYVITDEKRELVKMETQWKIYRDVSEARFCRVLNTWNASKIFAQAFMQNEWTYLAYYMCTDGGINAVNFNKSLERFFSIANIFKDYLSDEDIL